MDYIEVKLTIQPQKEYLYDLLSGFLAEIGFESFEKKKDSILAYIPENVYNSSVLEALIADFSYAENITYSLKSIAQINWNEEWEKYFFEPILIGNECLVHSSFHKNLPKAKYEIIIDPKMAFGTGHHETTSLMIEEILSTDFKNKKVLDMGCGTAVLAILAAKKGAQSVLAVDIDDWCVENSLENIQKNNTPEIEVLLGDASLLNGKKFDIILAKIIRNILQKDMATYAACLEEGGTLYMSGFYQEDIPILEKEAKKHGLKLASNKEKNRWSLMHLFKTL